MTTRYARYLTTYTCTTNTCTSVQSAGTLPLSVVTGVLRLCPSAVFHPPTSTSSTPRQTSAPAYRSGITYAVRVVTSILIPSQSPQSQGLTVLAQHISLSQTTTATSWLNNTVSLSVISRSGTKARLGLGPNARTCCSGTICA
jgi:hypothetical protein